MTNFGFNNQQTPIRGAGFLVFGQNDLNQTWTQTGLNYYANTVHGNWVVFTPYWMYNSNLNPGPLQSGVGEWYSNTELLTAINWAKEAGLKIMLKPMIDPLQSDITGTWRANLDPGTSGIAAFMSSYNGFISNYATIAEENNIDLFCIGCELNTLVSGPGGSGTTYTPYWIGTGGVIPTVRSIYSGPITYAGYPGDPSEFLADLDYLGYDFYPNLFNVTVAASLNSPITQGATVTSLSVFGLSGAIAPGTINLYNGNTTQAFTTTGAAAGATTVPVTSTTALYSFPQWTYIVAEGTVSGTTDVSLLETNMTTPTAMSGSTSYIEQIAAYSAANGNKKVIITETGFENLVGSASNNPYSSTPAPAEQAAAVQALVTSLEQGNYSWYEGLFFWGWFCHYYQVNGNNAWNQYGNKAEDALAALWSPGLTLTDASGNYLHDASGNNIVYPSS